MAKAIKTYCGGINYRAQAAVRDDGALFMRLQDKTPYGYRWTAWQQRGAVDINALPETIPCGFSDLRRPTVYEQFTPRLPNA